MGYRLKEDESVPDGIKRISLDQIDRALGRLSLKTRNKDRAVHEARVCFKKIRAVLRLVYGELGRDIFSLENREYRDAGRPLSRSRDTEVVAGTLEELVHHFNKQLANPDIKTLRKRLRQSRAEQQIDRKQVLPQVAEAVSSARERVETWPVINDGFSALRPGLQRVYKRGRAGFILTSTDRATENLHEWRKQVKYLWYQVCVLNPMWPQPLDVLADELNKLADYLSEDHDLALLSRTAIDQAQALGAPDEVEKLVFLIDQRRIQLQAKATALGARIYAEKPKTFVNRIQLYWEAWRPESATEPVEDPQLELAFEATSASST
ncbi:MAG TPA: CHAD domain-containing protein [Blastocatellia bacterium]|nr:CHAD domain-containing protein [Blastocatellia bacterium]